MEGGWVIHPLAILQSTTILDEYLKNISKVASSSFTSQSYTPDSLEASKGNRGYVENGPPLALNAICRFHNKH